MSPASSRPFLRRLPGAAAALCWILSGVTAVILIMAGSGSLLSREMRAWAPPETTGLPASEYDGVGALVADYLTDRAERFQYTYRGSSGAEIRCFQPHEEAHMADVRGLIRLDRTVLWISLAAVAALTVYGLLSRRAAPEFRRGIRTGLLIFAVLAGAAALWALVNFDGLFITFHRLAFTNDGWLLNPRTDLLIRLMPESFFISLGRKGALAALAVPCVLGILSFRILPSNRRGSGQ